ncbi:MAG TPA: hypothetical protein VGP73_18545 [Thermoanaerobaculia bacterium]
MEQEYHVTVTLSVTTDDPATAAREAYDLLRFPRTRPTRFTVRYRQSGIDLEMKHPVELGTDNPLGRPDIRIEDGLVLCGHRGSEKTYYVEEVGQYGPLWVKNGHATCWSGDLEVDEVGDDPHVVCFGCGLESRLPPDFQWAGSYDPDS